MRPIPRCANCFDVGWVCENHPSSPWSKTAPAGCESMGSAIDAAWRGYGVRRKLRSVRLAQTQQYVAATAPGLDVTCSEQAGDAVALPPGRPVGLHVDALRP